MALDHQQGLCDEQLQQLKASNSFRYCANEYQRYSCASAGIPYRADVGCVPMSLGGSWFSEWRLGGKSSD